MLRRLGVSGGRAAVECGVSGVVTECKLAAADVGECVLGGWDEGTVGGADEGTTTDEGTVG